MGLVPRWESIVGRGFAAVYSTVLKKSSGADLSADELYSLLRLRVRIFVVEQQLAYEDLDGLDLLTSTDHFWHGKGKVVVSCLRVSIEGGDVRRIGRVCTEREHRGRGIAGSLMEFAVSEFSDNDLVLDAQSYVFDFYRRFGFVVIGPEYLDDGVPHLPLRRDGRSKGW